MACDSSHMEPTYDEIQSNKVCQLICILFDALELNIPDWIKKASDDYYGNPRRLTEAEKTLYRTIVNLQDGDINIHVYNAHSKNARALANWYEDYDKNIKDEIEQKRIEDEREKRAKSILAKIRSDDVEILRNYFGLKI